MNNAPHFPSTAGLEVASDSGELIYGGTVGINRLLGMLRDTAYQPRRTEWSVIFVNMRTLVTNAFHKDKAQHEIAQEVSTDIALLREYVESYARASPVPRTAPILLVFYGSDYSSVPAALRRDPSEKEIAIGIAYERINTAQVQKPHRLSGDVRNVESWYIPGEASTLPHKTLFRWLRLYTSNQRTPVYTQGAPIGIVTHIVSDLHITRLIPNVMLWERYTGRVKRPDEFGTKLHKDGIIPFYPCTHRVFGDDWLIKPLISGRPRTALFEKARDRKWSSMSEDTILRTLSAETGIAVSELSAFKF